MDEREMCTELPQEELMNALEAGQEGIIQLLECVRVSLMVEDAVAITHGDTKCKRKRERRNQQVPRGGGARAAKPSQERKNETPRGGSRRPAQVGTEGEQPMGVRAPPKVRG